MASLKDTVISGSLRVTDTTYTNDLILGKTYTARYVLAAPTSNGIPTFRALTNADVGLSNVENTKLSTWAGTSNITTVGTISSGTWNGTTIAVNKGGTGTTSWTQWGVLYASASTTLTNTTAGTAGYLLQSNATSAPSWIQATNANTGNTIVKRDASGNFSAGTITATLSGNATSASSVARATFGDASNGEHNCNSIASNGLWYYTSNGPSGLGNYTADGALYSQAHNSNWVGQIAQDYRNGGLFVRSKNNNSWQSWRAIPNGIHYTMTDKNIVYDASTEKFTKVAGGESDWNSQVISTIGYKECRVTFQAGQANKYIMAGLNTDPAANASWTSIDYCWYLTSSGSLEIRESNSNTISPGTGHTSYAAGDEFIIEYSNGYIRYYHNGALCRAVSRTIGGLLYFDSSFYSYGNIYNVQFAPIQSNVSYGTALPASAVEGQTFFQISDPWYELPPGGTAGQTLIKASNSDRDVTWGAASGGGTLTLNNTTKYYVCGSTSNTTNANGVIFNTSVYVDNSKLFGAAWNDYAEKRKCDSLKPGSCVIENDDGKLSIAVKRLTPGACIISDTYGMCIGETEEAKTPIAITGRVLAYTYQPRENYHAGMAVCSAPNGTIDIMTREEIRNYPDAIIGIVSEIPNYEYWGTGNIQVDNRIWIKIK